jgi:hypothetical protein
VKYANQIPVGSYAIGLTDLQECRVIKSEEKRGRKGMRAHGDVVVVYLVGLNPESDCDSSFEPIAKAIAEKGAFGLANPGLSVVIVKRDVRADDVQLVHWFPYYSWNMKEGGR